MTSHSQDTGFFSLSNGCGASILQAALNYIEENLLEELTPSMIAAHFFVSTSTISSLFKVVCGMTIMEYIRNRRLTLAAEELSSSNTPIINLACKYGYDTPEAFTKAFSRFHGFPPSFIRRGFPITNVFLPLQISVTVQGGWNRADLTKIKYPAVNCGVFDPRGIRQMPAVSSYFNLRYTVNTSLLLSTEHQSPHSPVSKAGLNA